MRGYREKTKALNSIRPKRRVSLFLKVVAIFLVLGIFPTLLLGVRLLTLAKKLLTEGGEGWRLPEGVASQVTQALASETWAYLLAVGLICGVIGFFASGSLIGPLRSLQKRVHRFDQSGTTSGGSAPSGDEIEDLAVAFSRLAQEQAQLQRNLEVRVAERTYDLQQRSNQLEIAAEFARETTATQNLDELLQRAIYSVYNRFGLYHVAIFLLDDRREYAVLRAATGEAGRAMLNRGHKFHLGDVGILNQPLTTGAFKVVNNLDIDFTYVKEPLLPRTRSEIVLPLKVGEQLLGVLDMQSTELNAFKPESVVVLQVIADQLAIAIQNVCLLADLQSSLQEVQTLYQRYTRESWTHPAGMEGIGYQYDFSRLSRLQRILPPELLSQLEEGKALALSGAETAGNKNAALLLAPLMMYDQLIGVLGLEEDNPDHEWAPEEIALIEAVTNQVSLAIDNVRLLEEAQRRSEDLRLLQEITAAAAAHIDLSQLLKDVSQRMVLGFNLLHCGVVLFDPDGKSGAVVVNASLDQEPKDARPISTRLNLEASEITRQVIDTRQTQVIYDIQSDKRVDAFQDLVKNQNAQTMILVPLQSRGEVIGTIGLVTADPDRRFTQDELRLFDQISLQISTAVDVARSFEQATQRAEYEREIGDVAARIRQTLDVESVLQTAVNEIYRVLQAEEVSIQLIDPEQEMELVNEIPG